MCAVVPERFLPLRIQRCRVRYDTYDKSVTRAVFHLEISALKLVALLKTLELSPSREVDDEMGVDSESARAEAGAGSK